MEEQASQAEALRAFADIMSGQVRFECCVAASTQSALQLISSWEPSVIMIDVNSQLQTAMQILEYSGEGFPPVVISVEHESNDLRTQVLAKGASALVNKSQAPEYLEGLFLLLAELSTQQVMRH